MPFLWFDLLVMCGEFVQRVQSKCQMLEVWARVDLTVCPSKLSATTAEAVLKISKSDQV